VNGHEGIRQGADWLGRKNKADSEQVWRRAKKGDFPFYFDVL